MKTARNMHIMEVNFLKIGGIFAFLNKVYDER